VAWRILTVNPRNLNEWLQIIGLFGVIGSLVFVGFQLKQTQDIAVSENYQNRTSAIVELNAGAMSSPEFLSGVSKVYLNRSDELTMPEAVALEWYIGTNLALLENNYLQFEAGFLTPEHWQGNLNELDCILTVPLFRDTASDWNYRESFRNVLSDAMQEISDDAENCWAIGYDWNFPMQ
jgi:hypothetical protein